MILARTLRRTFVLEGSLPEDCVAFLHSDPLLPAPTERTDVIGIEPRDDGLFSMRCPWGRHATGSGRVLARSLGEAFYRLAASDEGATPSINASAFRLEGTRILLVAEIGIDLSDLTVALLLAGVAFEGTGLVFIRAGGVVAHPMKPHLRVSRLASVGLFPAHGEPPMLHLDCDEEVHCAIDPRIAGVEWSVMEGPAPILLFVERNDGGCSAIAGLRFDTALARLMRSIRSKQRPGVQAFMRIRAMIEGARAFRVSMGNPIATAALIVSQMALYAR